MTKRVAWFTGEPSVKECFTPYKVYELVREGTTNFGVINDKGVRHFCLKKGCAHICYKDWVFADVVEGVKEAVTEVVEQTKPKKAKKWSAWIKNTTGKQPVADGIIVKTKFARGSLDKDKAEAYWWVDKALTHYKVKLKDVSEDSPKAQEKLKSKWIKNTGICPVDGNITVMMKFSDGTVDRTQAQEYSWDFGQSRKIIKWRLAD